MTILNDKITWNSYKLAFFLLEITFGGFGTAFNIITNRKLA